MFRRRPSQLAANVISAIRPSAAYSHVWVVPPRSMMSCISRMPWVTGSVNARARTGSLNS